MAREDAVTMLVLTPFIRRFRKSIIPKGYRVREGSNHDVIRHPARETYTQYTYSAAKDGGNMIQKYRQSTGMMVIRGPS